MCLKLHNLDPLNDMLTQEKIINFVRHERKTFKDLPDPCTVIGSAGLLLCGLLIPYVSDIDILTSKRNYEILKKNWKKHLHSEDHPEHGKKFDSHFFSINFQGTRVEVMAELRANVQGRWQSVDIMDHHILKVEDIKIFYPTLLESIRILKLFNREKDRSKLTLIEHHLHA